jgi:hypothetical protein
VSSRARLESTLGNLVELAAEELEAWELSAMRDPATGPRSRPPAAAVVVGAAPRSGSRSCAPSASATSAAPWPRAIDLADATLRDLAHEARRIADDARGAGVDPRGDAA